MRANKLFFLLMVLFLIAFPKGGIKIGSIPLTWGYLFIGLMALIRLPAFLAQAEHRYLSQAHWLIMALLLPLQAISVLTLLFYGYEDKGFAISLLTNIFFLPLFFLVLLNRPLQRLNLNFLIKYINLSVLFISLYGIFLFFYKIRTGSFIEVPFLTVNSGDLGNLGEKNIDRGDGIFKLISTYNNGNIYGICVLMLLPLFCYYNKGFLKQNTVKLSLLLSLSRTVWIGLIFYEIGYRLFIEKISFKKILAGSFIVLTLVFCIVMASYFMNKEVADFLFSKDLGGRDFIIDQIAKLSLFPQRPFEDIAEIIYISFAYQFGLLGLCAFLAGHFSLPVSFILKKVPFPKSGYKKSLFLGLSTYLIVAVSDGGFLYIPVMAIFWLVGALLLSNNPSFLLTGRQKPYSGAFLPIAQGMQKPAS